LELPSRPAFFVQEVMNGRKLHTCRGDHRLFGFGFGGVISAVCLNHPGFKGSLI
jgi:hypothetical protein